MSAIVINLKPRRVPITFTMDGDVFYCVDNLPAHAVTEVALSVSADGEKQMRAALGFLDLALVPDSIELFSARMKSKDNPIDLPEIIALFPKLIEAYQKDEDDEGADARPTGGSNGSAIGSAGPVPSLTVTAQPAASILSS